MRTRRSLVGGLILLLAASAGVVAWLLVANAGGNVHAPPSLNRQLLTGAWKNNAPALFVTGYEFADDGTLKVTIRGMEQPLVGRYAWTGDRSLQLEFQASPEGRQAYKAAAKGYKDQVKARIQAGDLYERAGPSMLGDVADELPAMQTFQVALSEQPPLLILNNDSGGTQTFVRPE
jgi:hypothetical protein